MDDLISRQAAIDEIKEIYEWHDNVTKERIIEHFERLPSAQPERKKGEWIWKDRPINKNYMVTGTTKYGEKTTVYVHEEGTERRNYCPVCGKLGDDTFMNFCPNCGAEMRGERNVSVIVKGMKMPICCDACALAAAYGCRATGKVLFTDDMRAKRDDDCPLVEIPTPHGRIVDIDKTTDLLMHGDVRLTCGDAAKQTTIIGMEFQ